jgi:ubiquinone/menaquinone biosynthesis C-methylase UbiE
MSDPPLDALAASFGRVADDYDRGRPSYPPEALDWLVAELRVGASSTVVDLAAGTGKLTRLLVGRYPRVVAVEPSAGMRAVLHERVPGAEILEGTAEAIPLADASVDAVFVAEAFHWFDPHTAGGELRRIVRSGGTVIACFHEPAGQDELPPEARQVLRDVLSRAAPPGSTKVATGAWKAALAGDGWTSFEESVHGHEETYDREAVLAAVISFSSIAQLPVEEREELRQQLRGLLPDRAATHAFQTRVFRTVRT